MYVSLFSSFVIIYTMDNLGQRENRTSKEVIFFSGEALKLIEEADNCSTRHYASATGLEAWFSVPEKLNPFLVP